MKRETGIGSLDCLGGGRLRPVVSGGWGNWFALYSGTRLSN